MDYPAFFDEVPGIRVHDPLLAFLGASRDGVIHYGYLDAVKLAGHSCPTVAGAYLMVLKGLAALYGDVLPERGGIRVYFPDAQESGTTGVIANVFGLITGAASSAGFKGIAGSFNRSGLMSFTAPVDGVATLHRIDTGASVTLRYQPEVVSPDPALRPLMQRTISGQASDGERQRFADLWQDRVRRILVDHRDDPALVLVTRG
ncbi:MAG: hypothetical protein HQL33_02500 [Alphaproteobacteria bacterium]|nr:hypothetical protein [Alphaproteobacteria bacterium]